MASDENEEKLLRSVALQNAQSILLARQQAEQALIEAKVALELRTEELAHSLAMMRATLESTTDGILVTDDAGKVTGFNGKFVEMWRIPPPETMDSREHRQLLEVCGRQFKDPEQFRLRVEEIYASSPPESYDLLELVDGIVVERFSKIQRIDERNVGRVWSFRDITQRRRAEEALQKQSEWLRVTLFSIGDAVITTDTEERVTSLNPLAESLTGWTQQEAQGRPLNSVFRMINEQSRQPVENPATRAMREGRIVGLANHTVLIAKDGTERAIDDSAAPIRAETGHISGVVLIFRDVTEARRAAKALQQSEARYRSLTQAITSVVWTVDEAGRFVTPQPSWSEYTGQTWEELRDFGWANALHPDDRERVWNLWEAARASKTLYKSDGRLWHTASGSYRHFEARGVPILNADGSVREWVGKCLDVEDRKRAEQTTRFLADASAELAELTDPESTLQKIASLAVPFFADWCAVDLQEADGSLRRLAVTHIDRAKVQLAHELYRRYPPSASDSRGVTKVLRSVQSDWAAEIPDSLLIRLAQDEEHLRLLRELGLKSYICVPLKAHTKALGAITFVTAESSRIYETDDVRAAEDLAHRAVIAIENASLLATLKESDRRKDEFLAMLAHELRNPLAPIRNAAEILRVKGPPVPELQWAREVIDRQIQQMTRLIDDLLDVSRITTGKIELRRERVELAAVVKSAVEASRPLIEKWGHELTVTIPPEPIHLEADSTRLSQVLLNLLNNAAKYTHQGGRIWLTAERQSDQVLIRVKDTGIGISAEMLPRIFEMFTQVDRSLERSQGGLGIGLMLVQRLVEMHGGTVEAHSAGPGKGSEFVLRFPMAVEVKERKPQEEAGYCQKDTVPSTCRILVVDDNQDSAESIAILLRTMGNEVHTANDGLEAVGAAAAFQPDVVLLDIGLPKLNGFDAARRIREQSGGSDIVLIALTGWGQEEDRRRSKEAGFDHHLTKPVDFGLLQKLLASAKLNHPERRPAKQGS